MFRTRLRAVLLTATALSLCTSVTYAAREEHQFDVSVTIPTFEFYAIPADPEFVLREQPMRWNLVSSTLEPLRTQFDMISSAGAMTARLGYEPVLSNGHTTFALRVTFNEQVLTLFDSVVVSAADAYNGIRVPVRIDALPPAEGFEPGDYYGSVQLIFDTAAP